MPLDALHINAQANRLNAELTGGRIDRILQPYNDEVIILAYANRQNHRVSLSANPNYPGVYISTHTPKNPMNAPSFCMLLRKHLLNANIEYIRAFDYERAYEIGLRAKNELNDSVLFRLIIECVQRYPNIILADEQYVILDCLKHVPLDIATSRCLFPRSKYQPLTQKEDKINITSTTALKAHLKSYSSKDDEGLGNYILKKLYGLASVSIEEALHNCFQDKIPPPPLSENQIEKIVAAIEHLYVIANDLNSNAYMTDKDFALFPFSTKNTKVCEYDNVGIVMSKFLSEKIGTQRRQGAIKKTLTVLKSAIQRDEKKILQFKKRLEECEDKDKLRLYGDLITNYIYLSKDWKGRDSVMLLDYNTNQMVNVPLDLKIQPKDNAKQYYKKYAKLKRSESLNLEQLVQAEEHLDYLNSIKASIEMLDDVGDLKEIDIELEKAGIKRTANQKLNQARPVKQKKSLNEIEGKPYSFEYKGYRIRAGKNNLQNDRLTFRSQANDIWLHALSFHGSHVLISAIDKNPIPLEVIEYAAQIAAYYSKARSSERVTVDYTFVKHVKKLPKSPPGKVVYTNQKSLIVNPTNLL